MLSTKKGIVLALCLALCRVGSAMAEPSYLVYPANVPTIFRYDVGRYDLVSQGQEKFDPSYAIGNQMLWDRVDGRVPVEIYGAPELVGFEPTSGTSEFVTYMDEFDLIIQGFATEPRTLGNLCLRFWPYSVAGAAVLTVDGIPTSNLVVPLPSIDASVPMSNGFYVGSGLHHVSWIGAGAMEVVAFSDKDGDGGYQGTPAYRIVARHAPVATHPTSWGKVKSLFR